MDKGFIKVKFDRYGKTPKYLKAVVNKVEDHIDFFLDKLIISSLSHSCSPIWIPVCPEWGKKEGEKDV
jgi:hypothetical protein